MLLNHIAYRTFDRVQLTNLFIGDFGYNIQEEFDLTFEDGTFTKSFALQKEGAPELFVSDGEPGSIVYEWVKEHGPGVHHIAYRVDDVEKKMKQWIELGIAEFSTDKPIYCPEENLVQVFTKPIPVMGHIIELIERVGKGFCSSSVKKLMEASK